jgi:hypothetical protein
MAIVSVDDELLTTGSVVRSLCPDTMVVGATFDQACMSSTVSDHWAVSLVSSALVSCASFVQVSLI